MTKQKTVSLWLTDELHSRLKVICEIEHVTRTDILKKLLEIFLSDITVQRRVLEEMKQYA